MASCKPTAHRGGPCENGDEEMGLSRRRPVGGLRLRGPQTMAHLLSYRLLDEACTADDLATVTERADMRPQVGENCVKDTTEEEESAHVSAPYIIAGLTTFVYTFLLILKLILRSQNPINFFQITDDYAPKKKCLRIRQCFPRHVDCWH